MAALPPAAYLRRHALPAHFLHRLARLAPWPAPRPAPCPAAPPSERPRLAMRWHLDARGRLACRWTIEPPPG